MRILFIDYYFPPAPGGSEVLAGQLVKKLVSLGHDVMVLTRSHPDRPTADEWHGAKILRLGVPKGSRTARLFFSFAAIRPALKLVKEFKPDALITQELFAVLAGYFVKRNSRLPYIHIHELISDSIPTRVNKFKLVFQRFMLPRLNCDTFVSWSKFMKEKYLDKWGVKNVVVIPAAVDTALFNPSIDGASVRRELGIEGSFLLVTAKQLYKISANGLNQTIEAVAKLAPDYPKLKYLIVGEGDGKLELEALAERLGVRDRIIFAGQKAHSEIPRYLAAADAIVQTFTIEVTTGTSLLESAAMGKPLIVTDCGDIGSVLDDKSAYLTKMGDVPSVASAIRSVIDHNDIAQEKGMAAAKKIEKEFSMDVVVGKLLDLLSGASNFQKVLLKKQHVFIC